MNCRLDPIASNQTKVPTKKINDSHKALNINMIFNVSNFSALYFKKLDQYEKVIALKQLTRA